MRALLAREFIVMARRPAVSVVLAVHVAVLVLFLLVWSRGVPTMPGATLVDQQQTVQLVALIALLPWAAARMAIPERGAGFAICAAIVARRPSSIVLARVGATAAVLGLIAVSGLPAVVLAQQMSAVPLATIAIRFPELASICVVAAASATGWALTTPDRLVAWIGGTFTTMLLVGLLRWWAGAPRGYTLAIVAGTLLAVIVALYSDRVCTYARA